MSWEQLITHVLATTSKVDTVVVYDLRGRPVAVTEGTETSESEGAAVVRCLNDPALTMTQLHVGDELFVCVQGIDKSFIGTSVSQPTVVMVALQEADHVIVVIGESQGRGSFIFELKQCLRLKAIGKLVPQEQHLQQDQALSDADVTSGSGSSGSGGNSPPSIGKGTEAAHLAKPDIHGVDLMTL